MSEKLGGGYVELAADTSKLEKGVDEAARAVQKFETKVQKALKALEAPKRAQDSMDAMVQAVNRLGGVANLSSAQVESLTRKIGYLTKAGAQLPGVFANLKVPALQNVSTAALDKILAAPGKGVAATQAAIKDLASAAQGAISPLGPLGAGLGALGPTGMVAAAGVAAAAFAVEKAIATFAEWSKQGMKFADDIVETADALSLSTDALQEWHFAASQAGMSVEVFDRGVDAFNRKMAEGSAATKQAVEDLGFKFEQLRSYQPEQRLDLVVKALQRIADPDLRRRLAQEFFDKSARETMKLLATDIDAARAAAVKLPPDVIAAMGGMNDKIDSVSDAWLKFKAALTSGLTTSPEAAKGLDDLVQNLADLTAQLLAATPIMTRFFDQLVSSARGLAQGGIAGLGTGMGASAREGFLSASSAKSLDDLVHTAAVTAGIPGALFAGGSVEPPGGAKTGSLKDAAYTAAVKERVAAAEAAKAAAKDAAEAEKLAAADAAEKAKADRLAAEAMRNKAEAARTLADLQRQLTEASMRFAPVLEQEVFKIQATAKATVAKAAADLQAKRINKEAYDEIVKTADAIATKAIAEKGDEAQVRSSNEAIDEKKDALKAEEEGIRKIIDGINAEAEKRRALGRTLQDAQDEYDALDKKLQDAGGLQGATTEQLENYLRKLESLRGFDVPGLLDQIKVAQEALKQKTDATTDSQAKQRAEAEKLSNAFSEIANVAGQLNSILSEMGGAGAEKIAAMAEAAEKLASSMAAMSRGDWVSGIAGAFESGYTWAEKTFGDKEMNYMQDQIAQYARVWGLQASDQFWAQFKPQDNLWAAYYMGIVDVAADQGKSLTAMAGDFGKVFSEAFKYGADGLQTIQDLMQGLEEEVGKGLPGSLDALQGGLDLVMAQMRTGQMSGASGVELLGNAYTALGQAAEAGVEGAHEKMLELIRDAKEAGVTIPEIADAIRGNMRDAAGALQHLAPIVTREDALSQAQMFANVWDTTVGDLGIAGAMGQLGPAWEQIQAGAAKGGFDISSVLGPGIAELLTAANPAKLIEDLDARLEAGKITKEEHAAEKARLDTQAANVKSFDAVSTIIDRLASSDALKPETFAAAQQQLLSTRERLLAGGMSEAAVSDAVGPLLAKLMEAGQQFGQELSPDVQALFDKSGLVLASDATETTADAMTNDVVPALWQLVELQGGVAPALDALGNAMKAAAAGGVGPPTAPTIPSAPIPPLAGGGIVSAPGIFQVGEAGPEAVIPLSDLGPLLEDAVARALARVDLGGSIRLPPLRLVDGAGRVFAETTADGLAAGGPALTKVANAVQGIR